jgi:hypothetical protein
VPPAEEGPFVISSSSSALTRIPDNSVIASLSSSDMSVTAPPTDLKSAAPNEEPLADHTLSPDMPVPSAPEGNTTSSASVIECSPTQCGHGDPRVTGMDDLQDDSATQHEDSPAVLGYEHCYGPRSAMSWTRLGAVPG